jgi:selenocysteine lyase/cysteine desulfurase
MAVEVGGIEQEDTVVQGRMHHGPALFEIDLHAEFIRAQADRGNSKARVKIRDHDVRLANRLREGLELAPSNSAIVSVDIDEAERKLARAGIKARVRAGRIRLSCHVYTTDKDVDDALTTLTAP